MYQHTQSLKLLLLGSLAIYAQTVALAEGSTCTTELGSFLTKEIEPAEPRLDSRLLEEDGEILKTMMQMPPAPEEVRCGGPLRWRSTTELTGEGFGRGRTRRDAHYDAIQDAIVANVMQQYTCTKECPEWRGTGFYTCPKIVGLLWENYYWVNLEGARFRGDCRSEELNGGRKLWTCEGKVTFGDDGEPKPKAMVGCKKCGDSPIIAASELQSSRPVPTTTASVTSAE